MKWNPRSFEHHRKEVATRNTQVAAHTAVTDVSVVRENDDHVWLAGRSGQVANVIDDFDRNSSFSKTS
jgi:hypothetical protein